MRSNKRIALLAAAVCTTTLLTEVNRAAPPKEAVEVSLDASANAPEQRAPILDASARSIAFQALLTDGGGNPLPDGAHTLDFFIYATDVGGAPIGSVLNVSVNTTNGIGSAQVGPLDPTWFDGSGRWMALSVDDLDDDPIGDELAPRILMGVAPHALRVDRVKSPELDDVIALGTSSDHGLLNVFDGAAGQVTVELDGANNMIRTFGDDGIERVRLWSPLWGSLTLSDTAGVGSVVLNAATTKTLGGELQLRDTTGQLRYDALATGTGGALNLYDSVGVSLSLSGIDGIVSAEGSLDVRVSIGGTLLGRLSTNSFGGRVQTWDENGGTTVRLGSSSSASDGGFAEFYRAAGGTSVFIDGEDAGSGAGLIDIRDGGGASTITLDGSSGGAGLVRVSDSAGQQAIRLDGAGNKISTFGDDGTENSRLWGPDWGEVLLFDADPGNDRTVLLSARTLLSDSGGVLTLFRHDGAAQGVTFAGGGGSGGIGQIYNNAANITVTLDGDDGNGHSLMVFSRSDGTDTVTIEAAETSTQGAAIKLFDSAGTKTIELDADFNGEGRVITQVLQVTGGADLSEQFEIHATGTDLKPGMVVVIDPRNPGELTVSRSAYDRAVAGVISGAGGLKPGMLMGQRDSEADGAFPVALTGRVYCLANATNGAIQPGDLLTTSNTTGHCMKVTDHHSAQGAILGKAMTALESGKGLVLVLVSLQ